MDSDSTAVMRFCAFMVADLNNQPEQARTLLCEMVEADGLPQTVADDYFARTQSAAEKRIHHAKPID